MKTLKINFSLLLLACFSLMIVLSSCNKESLDADLLLDENVALNTDSAIDNRGGKVLEGGLSIENGPNIIVTSIAPGRCVTGPIVGPISGMRNVRLTLDETTFSFFCGNGTGNDLAYRFYDSDNPCDLPLTRYSNQQIVNFPMPAGVNYTLVVCASVNGCNLDCSGGTLSIPGGISTSSPLYQFTLGPC